MTGGGQGGGGQPEPIAGLVVVVGAMWVAVVVEVKRRWSTSVMGMAEWSWWV